MRPISAPSSHAHRFIAPLAVAAIVALTGSCLTPPEDVDAAGFGPSNQMTDSGRDLAPQPDAGGRDTGPADTGNNPDQGPPTDAEVDQGEPDLYVPCDGMCGADEMCLEPEQRCVECLDAADCGEDVCTDDNRCVECVSAADCDGGVCDTVANTCVDCVTNADCAMGVCNPDSNTCVDCITNAECTDPSASLCDTTSNTCTSCETSVDCGHLATTVCDTSGTDGVCVACLDDDDTTRAPCNGNSCDPATNTCTQTPTESVDVCLSCIADSECAAGHLCVPLLYNAIPNGSYCLKIFGGCMRPYGSPINNRTTTNGALASFCGINETHTTCDAVRAFPGDCSSNGVSDCAAEGAMCETVAGIADTCTYACIDDLHCPPNRDCSSGYCGG